VVCARASATPSGAILARAANDPTEPSFNISRRLIELMEIMLASATGSSRRTQTQFAFADALLTLDARLRISEDLSGMAFIQFGIICKFCGQIEIFIGGEGVCCD
jgi:hypothetical protein